MGKAVSGGADVFIWEAGIGFSAFRTSAKFARCFLGPWQIRATRFHRKFSRSETEWPSSPALKAGGASTARVDRAAEAGTQGKEEFPASESRARAPGPRASRPA